MKKAHQLFRYLSFTLIIAGLSVNNVIHAQIANEIISDINWQESGMGDNADYIYTGEKFNVGLGDNLTNLANTITFETTPEKQEQSWLSLFSDNEKSFSMTLLDANKFDPLNDQIDYSQNIDNKINEINKQESSLVNQTKTLIENLTNSQTIDSQINFSDTADKIVYQNVLQDIDSEYILLDSGVKENIIIKGASPDPVNTFYYELKLDNGIKYYSTNDTNPFNLPENTYYFTDNDGNYLAHFLPIYVYDSNHQVASSDQISFTLVPTANQNIYQIKIQIDFNWIIDSARQYPIIIDPTIVHNTNADFSAGMAMNRMNLNDNVLSIAQMPAAKDPSVVGLWHMDEESGNSVVDYSRNNNNGTSVNTTIADGKFDHARNFNGTSSYLTIPNSNNINFAYNQNFSVNLWMKVPTTQNNTMDTTNVVFEKWSDSGGYPFVLRMYNQTNSTNNGKLLFARYDGTNNPAIISTKAINDNQYHHISLIKNGTLLSIYIDGTLSNSTTDTTTGTTTNTSALYIGKRNGTNP
nr:LamG domain-containing protein [bacterium]